jgi:exoribonuclease R
VTETFSRSKACPSAIGPRKWQGNQATLTDDEYDERKYRINGRRHGKNFRLGDSVCVRVARINAFHSAIDFELAQKSKIGSS